MAKDPHKKQPLISVIIPIYNVAPYVAECIESVQNQTYTNLEIILVNDGSTDESGQLCRKYAAADKRIVAIHKKNGGLSDAKNAGLAIMKGVFVTFVDGDDYVARDYVETMYVESQQSKALIVTVQFQEFYDGDDVIENGTSCFELCETERALELMMYERGLTHSSWGKLYQADLFHGLRFPTARICEDLGTTYKLFAKTKKISVGTAQSYYYRQRSGSIINARFSPTRIDGLDFSYEQYDFMCRHYPDIVPAAAYRVYIEAARIHKQIPNGLHGALVEQCKNSIKKFRSVVLHDSHAPRRARLQALASYIGIYRLSRSVKRIISDNYDLVLLKAVYRQFLESKKTNREAQALEGYQKNEDHIFIFLAPNYGNLGDVAILKAQKAFIKQNIPSHVVVEIPVEDTYRYLKFIRQNIHSNDIITFIGGGNFGERYAETDFGRLFVINYFRKTKIRMISFPQTIEYGNTFYAKVRLWIAKRTIARTDNLLVCAREQKSYAFVKQTFCCDVLYCPDIVLSAFNQYVLDKPQARTKLTITIRNDIESAMNANDREAIRHDLKNAGLTVDTKDTSVDDADINAVNKYELLDELVAQYRSSRLVVTDRLHGMILCAVTGTPCIVFSNSNHKIQATYSDWLQQCDYIQFLYTYDHETFIAAVQTRLAATATNYATIHFDFSNLQKYLMHAIRQDV